MFRKWLLTISAGLLLSLPLLPSSGYADTAEVGDVRIDGGILQDNRVLIPLRSVSEYLGADVTWNQPEQEITIRRVGITIQLAIGSPKVRVDQKDHELDVPPQLDAYGVTYVPVRFVSEAFGADVLWNPKDQQVAITLDGQPFVVTVDKPKVEVPSSKRITDQRQRALVDKLNEATDISSIKQVRAYFSPYFTDRFINAILQNKGLQYDYRFKTIFPSGTEYLDLHTAVVRQASDSDSKYAPSQTLYRNATLIDTTEGWKVDAVSFQLADEVLNP